MDCEEDLTKEQGVVCLVKNVTLHLGQSEVSLVAFLSMQRKVTQNWSPENLAKDGCCYCNL